jgi:hypothetical protein
MRRTLFAAGFLSALGVVLLCQSAKSQSDEEPTPPSYCRPCLFYGGDFDASNPSANALFNGFIDSGGGPGAVYVPFYVPQGQIWTVKGLFSNNMSTGSFLDPQRIKWSISSGLSAGKAGTVIAQGEVQATLTATGRSWNGMTEYTALGRLTPQTAVTLTTGVYWMTAIPICTNPSCGYTRFYLSDVEDVPAPNHKGIEPTDDSFFLAPNDGWFFSPTAYPNGVCDGGGNGVGCDKFSTGLLGDAVPSE